MAALLQIADPYRRAQQGLVLPPSRLKTQGWDVIYAPFVVGRRYSSRFSDGSYGAWYGGRMLQTAIAETRYHRNRLLAQSGAPDTTLALRAFAVDIDGKLHDLRGLRDRMASVFASDDYAKSQGLARRLHNGGSFGIAYDSVRHDGGQCACAFHPDVLGACRILGDFLYHWNGVSIDAVYQRLRSP